MTKNDLRFGNKTFKTEKELNKHLKKMNKGKTPMFDPYSKTGKLKGPGAGAAWFKKLSKKAQDAYLKAHPNSKFAKGGSKSKTTKAKPKWKKNLGTFVNNVKRGDGLKWDK